MGIGIRLKNASGRMGEFYYKSTTIIVDPAAVPVAARAARISGVMGIDHFGAPSSLP